MGNIAIYATKGFEYLWILSFLAIFTGFYLYFTSSKFEPRLAAAGRMLSAIGEWFRVPEGLLFHQGHTWVQPDEADPGLVRVGLDDFAQKLVGKVDSVKTPGLGARVHQGETGWSLRIGGKSINMLSPVSGEIVGVNKAFQSNDPFGNGWVYKVKPDNLGRESKNLISGGLARKWMAETIEQLRRKMNPDLGAVYQDGGMVMPGMARNIDAAHWDKLAGEFFLTQ